MPRFLLFFSSLLLLACVSCTSEKNSENDTSDSTANKPVAAASQQEDTSLKNTESVQRSDLIGRRFRSSKKGDVGLGVDGVVYGYWHVSFEEQRVRWDYSDVRESGSYTVEESGSITAYLGGPGGGRNVDAYFHRASDRIMWDGMWYTSIPQDVVQD